jgi:hypothetical protein
MKITLPVLAATAILCLGSVSASAQTAVGGPQRRGATAPGEQTRTMSTPRPGAAEGAAGVGGPQATAPKAVPNGPKVAPAAAPGAPQATTAKQNGKGPTAPPK